MGQKRGQKLVGLDGAGLLAFGPQRWAARVEHRSGHAACRSPTLGAGGVSPIGFAGPEPPEAALDPLLRGPAASSSSWTRSPPEAGRDGR